MGWTEYFQTLLIYWDFATQPSPESTENGPKKQKCHRSEENGQTALGINNMKALYQWFSLLVWRIDVFKCNSISAVRPYMSTVCSSSDECFQIDNGTNVSKLRSLETGFFYATIL